MKDYTNADSIYAAIKAASRSNPIAFSLSKELASIIRKANKQRDAEAKKAQIAETKLNKALEAQQNIKQDAQRQVEQAKQQAAGSAVSRSPLPDDASKEEVRGRARLLLIDKLNSGTISAAEFGQFKDVFGLANETDDFEFEVVSFENAIIDCPVCGANVHKPVI